MLKLWVENGKGPLGGVGTHRTIRWRCVECADGCGFGKRYDFDGGADTTEAGGTMGSYRDARRIVLGNFYRAIMTTMLMGLPSWAMSKELLEMKSALREVEE